MNAAGFQLFPGRAVAALLAVAAATAISTAPLAPSAHAEDKPYKIQKDGTVDWATFNGYRRYHATCHVCHGPDALGSTFAPALADSLKTMTYDQFIDVVVNGRKNVSTSSDKVMPSFGTNPNVMCYINDLYAYLKARADGALPRGRPKHEPKPESAKEAEDACMG